MRKLSCTEILYFAFFILLSVAKGLGLYEGQKLFTLLVIPALICVVLKLVLTSYTRRQRVILSILLVITAIVYYESGELGILFVMFTILGMKDISLDKVLHLGLWVWTLCSILLCILSFFRIEHTVYRVSDKLGLGYIMRWSLGFTHPNILHITYLALCAFILHELAARFGLRHFLWLMLGNVLVFLYSVSYTGFGIVTLLLVGEMYVTFRPRFCLFEKIIVNTVLPFIILISFALPLMLRMPRFAESIQKLNLLVNTRINIANNYLIPECISLFGVKMSYLSRIQSYLSIDSSYIWAFIHYGIVPFVLLMGAYLILIWNYSKEQRTRELVVVICFLMAGITEPLLFNTSFKNVTLLFLGELLFGQKAEAEENPQSLIELPIEFGEIWEAYRTRIMAGVAAGAILGAILCGICYTQPRGYIVPRRNADWRDKSSVYLMSADDPDYEGYCVMNYQDAETPMQIVEGNAVVLETARYYVGSVLIGGLAGYVVCAGTININNRRRLRRGESI